MSNSYTSVRVTVRFYAELNDFLPTEQKAKEVVRFVHTRTTVKDLIEGTGVPHTQVDLILVNGEAVDFSYIVRPDDRVSVYPVFETIDISPLRPRLRPAPLRQPKFACDVHLGKLARHLRLLGLDTFYSTSATDPELVAVALREHRTILTRDTGLLKRKQVTHGYYIRNTDPRKQLAEVAERFDLSAAQHPFTRCLVCNSYLQPAAKQDILERLPERVKQTQETFLSCPACNRLYWKGSHFKCLQRLIDECR